MKIDFDGVQAFVAIAELGGFNKAARELHITQTALTRRIQKLEAYLGVRLLDRTTRKVELTVVGRDFLPQARAIVQETTSAVQRLKEMAQHGRGNLTVACIPTLASHVLPRIIREYAKRHPHNQVRLLDGTSDQVRTAVLHGRAELGIALAGESQSELVETAFFSDPLVFVCRTPHPLQERKTLSWNDMRGIELVRVSGLVATRVVMDYQLARHNVRLDAKYEVDHHATAVNLVAAGVGAAILPASTIREGDRPGIRKIPLTAPVVKRRVVLLRARRGSLSPAAEAFYELVRSTPVKV
ncbi:MAG TPA: LysR family transcriptional regulator [Ramlibacter sp.]|uniref:LysR family transcriptional regulator n=1 Tax=Ramlibacter sp. TaxID=1917967 RepID=UPI002D7E81B7|nr:LysR family transcriptional regulator [Ramlibacter sp.]HET8747254.1 LysR family transcriptional regulator [Ramlibacter sp.]